MAKRLGHGRFVRDHSTGQWSKDDPRSEDGQAGRCLMLVAIIIGGLASMRWI